MQTSSLDEDRQLWPNTPEKKKYTNTFESVVCLNFSYSYFVKGENVWPHMLG